MNSHSMLYLCYQIMYHSVWQPTFYMGLSQQTLNSLRERLYRNYSCILHACMLSRSVMSNSLRTHGLQHTRLPSPSPSPGAYSNSCPLGQWYHPTISSSVTRFSSCLQIFPSIRAFSNESVLHIRWPNYCSFSFSISPSNKYSGLISFRID